jgi:hypothetical protein
MDTLGLFLLGSIGKVGKEYATAVLHNVLDCQCQALSGQSAETAGKQLDRKPSAGGQESDIVVAKRIVRLVATSNGGLHRVAQATITPWR